MNGFESFKKDVENAKEQIFGNIDNIISEVELNGDVDKFYEKGVKSAGGRIRKALQQIRKEIHNPTIRGHMEHVKNSAKELRENLSNG